MRPGAASLSQELGCEGSEDAEPHDDEAAQSPGTPTEAQGHVSLPVGHEPTAAVDDEHLLRRDDGDDGRRRDPVDLAPTRSHLEERGGVKTPVREDPLDRAVATACKREADTVGEPVASDGARRVEPPALAQCNRHPATGPRYPAMRNSLS